MAVIVSGTTTTQKSEVDANFLAAIATYKPLSHPTLGQVNYYTSSGTGTGATSGHVAGAAIFAVRNPSYAHVIIPIYMRASRTYNSALVPAAAVEQGNSIHVVRNWLVNVNTLTTNVTVIPPSPLRTRQPASIMLQASATPSSMYHPRHSFNTGAGAATCVDAGAVYDAQPIVEARYWELAGGATVPKNPAGPLGVQYNIADMGTWPVVLQANEGLTVRKTLTETNESIRGMGVVIWAEMPNQLFDFYS